MVLLRLNWIQRGQLGALLGLQEGTLAKTAPFLRIEAKIRFTEEELAQIKVTASDGSIRMEIPPGMVNFGEMDTEIETKDAKALLDLFESWPHFKLSDHAWVVPLQDQLR